MAPLSSSDEENEMTENIWLLGVFAGLLCVLLGAVLFQLTRLFAFDSYDATKFRARKIFCFLLACAIICRGAWCVILFTRSSERFVIASAFNAAAAISLWFSIFTATLFWVDLLYSIRQGRLGMFFVRFRIPIVVVYVSVILFVIGLIVVAIVSDNYVLVMLVTGMAFSFMFGLLSLVIGWVGIRLGMFLTRFRRRLPKVLISGKRVLVLTITCAVLLFARCAWTIFTSIRTFEVMFPWTVIVPVAICTELMPEVLMLALMWSVPSPTQQDKIELERKKNMTIERPLIQ